MQLKLIAKSFSHNGPIPSRYTCEGENISPELSWHGLPKDTKSLALIMDDPDAPQSIWIHWIVYNIPTTEKGLAEGITAKDLPAGTLEGINDWQKTGYGGPCPPSGRHRYFFRLYALDTVLRDLHGPTKNFLSHNMEGHILAQTQLIGTYQKK